MSVSVAASALTGLSARQSTMNDPPRGGSELTRKGLFVKEEELIQRGL